MPTTSTPAPAQTPPLSPAQVGRHLLYRLVNRVQRASDAALVVTLIVGSGVVALTKWLVSSLAHGDYAFEPAIMAGLLWCVVVVGAVAIRNSPPLTPPATRRRTGVALDRGSYWIGFGGVIDALGRELAMLHRHRHPDTALIAQWMTLREQAWSADRLGLGPGARAAREDVVSQWNQARAARPEVFAPRIAPWLRHRETPVAAVAVLTEERADGRYITYPLRQRLRGLRSARAEITNRALMVTIAVIVAICAPFLAWAAMDAMWRQTTAGQTIPAHLDTALGGVAWVAGVIAAVIVIAVVVAAGWYVVATTASRRRLARAISSAVLVELVWLLAALSAAVVALTVMVAS